MRFALVISSSDSLPLRLRRKNNRNCSMETVLHSNIKEIRDQFKLFLPRKNFKTVLCRMHSKTLVKIKTYGMLIFYKHPKSMMSTFYRQKLSNRNESNEQAAGVKLIFILNLIKFSLFYFNAFCKFYCCLCILILPTFQNK